MYQNILQQLQQMFAGRGMGGVGSGAVGMPRGGLGGDGQAQPGTGMVQPQPLVPGQMPPGMLGGRPSFIDGLLGNGGVAHPIGIPGNQPTTGGELPPLSPGNVTSVPGVTPPGSGAGAIGRPLGPITTPAQPQRPTRPDSGFSLQPGQMPGGMRPPAQPRNPGGAGMGSGNTSGFTNYMPTSRPGGGTTPATRGY